MAVPVQPTISRTSTHLSQTLAGVLLRDVPLGDVLLEGGEQSAEEGHMVAEEPSLCDAPGVQGRKGDACLVVVAAVQLAHGQHVADLQARQQM